ncbi:leucine-rich repeat-containing protein 71-like [Gigantopelta aegis]|uniref:leucine-rich repeat-containing protein 71-like n=1 Tax=Gigantopelta aegis TaxID=1735272 RepID=UPI001B889907|nr:leucine-rich repeat-containing protein 71-like [Gigantopelta aegis]
MVRKQDKGHRSQSHDARDDEVYVCSGHFQTDFTELCRRNEMAVIPPVVLRPIPPCDVRPDKGKGKHHAHAHTEVPAEQLDENGVPIPPPPKTYTVKDSFEYFKPTVQVLMDNPDKQETVTEVYIRGWKIDTRMMDVFRQCWPLLLRLHSINLWNTGLSGEVVSILAAFLPTCSNVKNLTLDGNPVQEENWHELIGENSLIQRLSLRSCFITDKGAARIGRELGTLEKINKKLVTLDLYGNKITDLGCEHLAAGLRMNRTLLVLTLANNEISDAGCCKLAEVLSTFPLTHEEVVERRKQMSLRIIQPKASKSVIQTRTAKPSSKSDRGSSKSRKDGKGKDGQEDGRKSRREEKSKKASKSTAKDNQSTSAAKTSKPSRTALSPATPSEGKRDRKKEKRAPLVQEQQTELSAVMKVLDKVIPSEDQQLWIPGNRILVSLNLSRNRITAVGVEAMLKAMQHQAAAKVAKGEGAGLMRLNLLNIGIPNDHDLKTQLEQVMLTRDPHYKPPVTIQEDLSTKSDTGSKKRSNGPAKEK